MENTKELSIEEIELYSNKAKEIEASIGGTKVHPIVILHPETFDRKVCYVKEPTFLMKLDALDKAMTLGVYKSAYMLFEQIVLKEHSDAITFSDASDSDAYKLGVITEVSSMVEMYQNQFKKK